MRRFSTLGATTVAGLACLGFSGTAHAEIEDTYIDFTTNQRYVVESPFDRFTRRGPADVGGCNQVADPYCVSVFFQRVGLGLYWRLEDIYPHVAAFIKNPLPAALTSCGNVGGARYELPIGHHAGDNLVGLAEVLTGGAINTGEREVTIMRGAVRDRSNGSGWSFEPGALLHRQIVLLDTSLVSASARCAISVRYKYVGARGSFDFRARGVENVCTKSRFSTDQDADSPFVCFANHETACVAESSKTYWSTNGQVALDVSDEAHPRITFADGTVEQLEPGGPDAHVPFNEGLFDRSLAALNDTIKNDKAWVPARAIDRNGLVTRYEYDEHGWLRTVRDPRDRTTTIEREAPKVYDVCGDDASCPTWLPLFSGSDGGGRPTKITTTGAGGAPQSWELAWSTLDLDAKAAFPGVRCMTGISGYGYVVPTDCPRHLRFRTLASAKRPDGLSYRFEYGAFGNLVRVHTPDGAEESFDYAAPGTPMVEPPGTAACPSAYRHVLAQKVVATRIDDGLGNTRVTKFQDAPPVSISEVFTPGRCGALAVTQTTHPDGTIVKEGTCVENGTVRAGDDVLAKVIRGVTDFRAEHHLDGRVFFQETWHGDRLVEGAYYGDLSTGELFVAYEHAEVVPRLAPENGKRIELRGGPLDMRPMRIVRVRDGVRWEETYEYGDALPIDALDGKKRSTANVTAHTILASGSPVKRTERQWVTTPAYLDRGLVRLPAVTIEGGDGVVLSRTDVDYDETNPIPSRAPNRVDPGATARGNATTVTSYAEPGAVRGEVRVRTAWFDDGQVESVTNGRGHVSHTLPTFGTCSENPVLRTRTETPSPSPDNPEAHVTITATDCWTGKQLSVLDANKNLGCTQLDALGRVVETALPGDRLSEIDGGVRDPECPTTGASEVGSGGKGPTTWTRFVAIGEPGNARVETHTKNGLPEGRVTIAWSDGLSRQIASCSSVDAATHDGNRASCTRSTWDPLGRIGSQSVRFFTSALPDRAPDAPAVVPRRVTSYDALGRVTSSELVGSGTPATTYAYSGAGDAFVKLETAPGDRRTRTTTDVLGHAREVAVAHEGCKDGWCATRTTHDALGRLRKMIGPEGKDGGGGAVVEHDLDGLGRKIATRDADMGTWTFAHDENGNIVEQRDANGHAIRFTYDALDRLLTKTLPASSRLPEAERAIVNHWDGTGPAPAEKKQ